MESVRQLILRQFPSRSRVSEPDKELAAALYFMLRSVSEVEETVDGWALFRVIEESGDSLDTVGLMFLLPSGSVPMALRVSADKGGIAWSLRVGNQDADWLALSDSKRWNNVYLYASGERDMPPWTWAREYRGALSSADA